MQPISRPFLAEKTAFPHFVTPVSLLFRRERTFLSTFSVEVIYTRILNHFDTLVDPPVASGGYILTSCNRHQMSKYSVFT